MPEGATALEIPTDRPAYVTHACFDGRRPPASAVRLFIPPSERRRPEEVKVYFNLAPDPAMVYFAKRHAYAYITPADPPATFELIHPTFYGDVAVRFRTPEDREAAMRRQPFVLDGATVKLVREGETPNVRRVSHDYVVHLALRDYPVQQRTEKRIEDNCSSLGFVREIDPACFAAPDLATVRVVVQLEDPREIPREIRIDYCDDSTSVIPVEIVKVWHRSHSYDADGQYVRLFQAPAPPAA
ncbi:hypothetical protein BRADI_1g04503v3 [Brachypodium distachyon]|uniref:DUF4283 domain-containing protein n=1 Tax=Brachypodium distachyon TaxID=15368 RepID=A0A0Q3RH27_BRADI|nr:hypothetical protein BRADI_1g04503v3 [Brachypodium distachyon]